MKRLVMIACFLALCAELFAQDARPAAIPAYDRFPNGFGLAGGGAAPLGGFLSGGGLSYQGWNDGIGGQFLLGLYYPASLASSTGLQIWAGSEAYLRVLADEYSEWFFSQLYLFGGVEHKGFLDTSTWRSYFANFLTSAGIGIQAGLFQHFVLSLELGYGVSLPLFWIGPVAHMGFHYFF